MDDFGPGLIVVLVVLQIIGGLFASKKKKEAAQKAKQAEKNNTTPTNPSSAKNGEDQKSDPFKSFIEGMTQELQPASSFPEKINVDPYTTTVYTSQFDKEEELENQDNFKPEELYVKKPVAKYVSRPLIRDSVHIFDKLSTPDKLKEAFILSEIIGLPKAHRK
ncbi:MAG: hypothetical protein OCC49_04500 [Fibrobacterales bacterium]